MLWLGKDREGGNIAADWQSAKPIEIGAGYPFLRKHPETESLPAILPAESPAALLRWLCVLEAASTRSIGATRKHVTARLELSAASHANRASCISQSVR